MGKTKIRADQILVQKGLVQSREQARRLIMAGQVFFSAVQDRAGDIVSKPGQLLPADSKFYIREGQRFVSRGGNKLLSALDYFRIVPQDMVALDVGASSGGFTDCLLQHGAARVYAVDVGYGQLHWRLRTDPRVCNMERVNMRYAGPNLLPELVDLVLVDCSFISLRQILPACLQFVKPGGLLLLLVKPQFELGRGSTDKGIVRSQALQEQAVQEICSFASHELGLNCLGSVPAGIKGPKGNQEYFLLCRAC